MKRLVATIAVALGLVAEAAGTTPTLPSATEAGWQRYVAAVEARRHAEGARTDDGFLAMDFASSAGDRRSVLAGEILVRRVEGPERGQVPGGIDDALAHHWRGAVLLPGISLDALMARIQGEPPPTSREVLRAAILDRRPSGLRVYLRLQRTKIVTAVYDTEHEVTFTRHAPDRASSRSVATRIVELSDPGTPGERERASGEDRGFLWRLHAYWRYEAVPGGVVAECESISLSRDVPFGLGAIAGPIIRSTARESMTRTLESLRGMVQSD